MSLAQIASALALPRNRANLYTPAFILTLERAAAGEQVTADDERMILYMAAEKLTKYAMWMDAVDEAGAEEVKAFLMERLTR